MAQILTIHPVSSDPVVTIADAVQSPDADTLRQIDEIWANELASRTPPPFNGSLISIATWTPDHLTGWVTDYKSFVAQRRMPGLFPKLRVRPLAVSGLLTCRDGVVLGRRSVGVEMHAGMWELVPSGSVPAPVEASEPISLVAHLLTELEEELSIRLQALAGKPEAFAMIDDANSHVIDVAYKIGVNMSGAEVLAAFASASTSAEYSELQVVAAHDIMGHRLMSDDLMLPVSQALIADFCRHL